MRSEMLISSRWDVLIFGGWDLRNGRPCISMRERHSRQTMCEQLDVTNHSSGSQKQTGHVDPGGGGVAKKLFKLFFIPRQRSNISKSPVPWLLPAQVFQLSTPAVAATTLSASELPIGFFALRSNVRRLIVVRLSDVCHSIGSFFSNSLS